MSVELHGYKYSVYAWIARFALREKGISYKWVEVGKHEHPKLEPRILIEEHDLSYHAKERRSDDDIFDNVLIHGDKSRALMFVALEKLLAPPVVQVRRNCFPPA